MPSFLTPPLQPLRIRFDSPAATAEPAGPVLVRRMSSLEGLFEAEELRRELAAADDPVVYTVASSPVPATASRSSRASGRPACLARRRASSTRASIMAPV